jgi:hypothetical protein
MSIAFARPARVAKDEIVDSDQVVAAKPPRIAHPTTDW